MPYMKSLLTTITRYILCILPEQICMPHFKWPTLMHKTSKKQQTAAFIYLAFAMCVSATYKFTISHIYATCTN